MSEISLDLPYLKLKNSVTLLALELQETKNHALRNTESYLIWCAHIKEQITQLNAET